MDIILAIVRLVALLLIVGAYVAWRRTGEVKQPALMVLLAIVAIINVLIWTLPDASGIAPVDRTEELED